MIVHHWQTNQQVAAMNWSCDTENDFKKKKSMIHIMVNSTIDFHFPCKLVACCFSTEGEADNDTHTTTELYKTL